MLTTPNFVITPQLHSNVSLQHPVQHTLWTDALEPFLGALLPPLTSTSGRIYKLDGTSTNLGCSHEG